MRRMTREQQALAVAHFGVAGTFARRYRERMAHGQYVDFLQEMRMAVCFAATTYDDSRGVKMTTHAWWTCRRFARDFFLRLSNGPQLVLFDEVYHVFDDGVGEAWEPEAPTPSDLHPLDRSTILEACAAACEGRTSRASAITAEHNWRILGSVVGEIETLRSIATSCGRSTQRLAQRKDALLADIRARLQKDFAPC
jgi:hypothetical protein